MIIPPSFKKGSSQPKRHTPAIPGTDTGGHLIEISMEPAKQHEKKNNKQDIQS